MREVTDSMVHNPLTDGRPYETDQYVARMDSRLYDPERPVIGKLCALICVFLLIFTPIKLGSPVFYIGAVVVLIGLIGLAVALVNFRNTPPGEPVVRGMYRISRHPQIIMSSFVLLGGCISIGSWSAILALFATRIFSHFGLLAEEEVCKRLYGEAYAAYLEKVPRYFLFF